eukprot:CAMPEP_0172206676 /NCGR_PEP_ID=MMETSP1050-20130122/33360_1 /TAXON_ID=233186 /ORGANISM="Cryptomonas curvata, Strain CCAP979/52" /LENGTH=54 /DNA_ID=CAMNT_0012885805 /DNA_START=219 /DNA_END=382 /DNA_ORIENTATION=+
MSQHAHAASNLHMHLYTARSSGTLLEDASEDEEAAAKRQQDPARLQRRGSSSKA